MDVVNLFAQKKQSELDARIPREFLIELNEKDYHYKSSVSVEVKGFSRQSINRFLDRMGTPLEIPKTLFDIHYIEMLGLLLTQMYFEYTLDGSFENRTQGIYTEKELIGLFGQQDCLCWTRYRDVMLALHTEEVTKEIEAELNS